MQLHPSYILHLTFASVAAVYCLLGYWLAFGKQSWMWRAGAVCAALALLVPIRAYEPFVFFALTSLLFVASAAGWWMLGIWRKKGSKGVLESSSTNAGSPQPRFQFRLRDLLALMAVFGAAAWMVRTLLREQVTMPWVGTFISVAVAVTITLATIGVLRGPRRTVSGVVLLLVVGVSVGYFHWLHRMGPLFMGPPVQYIVGEDLGGQLFWSDLRPARQLLALLLTCVAFLAMFSGAIRAIQPKEVKPLQRRLWQTLGVAPYLAWLFPMSWLYLQLLSYPLPPSEIRDRPNVLPHLLERGQALESFSGARAQAVSAEVIKLSKQPGFVVVPWEADLRERKNYDLLYDFQTARSISRGLDAQATALETTEPDLAVEPLMACIRLGNMLEHEGLMIHGLGGFAVVSTGESHLIRLRKRISLPKVREIIGEFETLEKSRDDGHVVRDKLWYSLNDRWAFRLDQVLHSGAEHGGNSSYYYYGLGNKRSRCLTRLLMVDLALRAYHAEHGEYPPKLELLTPQYLTQIPLDPLGEKPFIYRTSSQGFVLYSVGGDGVDNGGTFGLKGYVPGQWDGYDLNLDAPRE